MTNPNRWWITGTFTTRTNLHLGNGDTVPNDQRISLGKDEHGQEHYADVAAIVTDSNGKPWLPGASLRGVVRVWCDKHAPDHVVSLFGWGDKRQEEAGKVRVQGGRYRSQAIEPALTQDTSHFNVDRLTLLEAGVAIDRVLGTASDQKLYYQEVVPPGVCFEQSIEVRDVEQPAIEALLGALEAFNSDALALGAETHSGKGRITWQCEQVRCLEGEAMQQWARDALVGKATAPLSRATPRQVTIQKHGEQGESLDITLRFEGLFCVNDPGRADWVKKEKNARKKTGGNTNDPLLADKQPRLDAKGRAYLPAKAFRGVFRNQMERIARTLGLANVCGEGTGTTCKPIHHAHDVGTLCPVCQLMGAPGWKSLLEIGDFRQQGDAQIITQEFLAIDRFTGGGADGKKFNTRAVVRPTLLGRLSLDETRLRWLKDKDTALALLAHTLRDLKEGDLRFGLGAAKGYGACKAEYAAGAQSALNDLKHWAETQEGKAVAWVATLAEQSTCNPKLAWLKAPETGYQAISIKHEPASSNLEFHNPYHFIPAQTPSPNNPRWASAKQVDWRDQPPASHAQYTNGDYDTKQFRYSGRIICRLHTLTPVVIGAQRDPSTQAAAACVKSFTYDEHLGHSQRSAVVPASSLRGLISALVESATNSSFRILENSKLSANDYPNRPKQLGELYEYFSKAFGPEMLPYAPSRNRLSPAELMFGAVSDTKSSDQLQALAGRIWPGDAIGAPGDFEIQPVLLKILDSPKPPCPALYFTGRSGFISKKDLSPSAHEPKGRKAYLHASNNLSVSETSLWQTAPDRNNEDLLQKAWVTPVKPGKTFHFHIDFANLSEWELGALCYAIQPSLDYRHKIGMGKPLGLGSVHIEPVGLFLVNRVKRYSAPSTRYAAAWFAESARKEDWGSRYVTEVNLSATKQSPSSEAFANKFRGTMNPDIRRAIELTGVPDAIHAPVHYPQIERGSKDYKHEETEHFRWFDNNEKKGPHQLLAPLSAATTDLPTLTRNKKP